MSAGRPDAQLMLAALSTAARLTLHRHGQQHQQALEQMRHGALAHMVEALVNRRVEAVERGFAAVLAQYADQAHHYMAQQRNFADRELDATDPLRRLELRSRINDLDTALATIRAEARLIYAHMTEVVRALGMPAVDFARDIAQPLALPAALPGASEPWN